MTKGWNHRVIATKHIDGIYLGIHEVYYDDAGKPVSATKTPIEVSSDSLDDIKWVLDMMQECLSKPILFITETSKIVEYNENNN